MKNLLTDFKLLELLKPSINYIKDQTGCTSSEAIELIGCIYTEPKDHPQRHIEPFKMYGRTFSVQWYGVDFCRCIDEKNTPEIFRYSEILLNKELKPDNSLKNTIKS